MRWFYRSLFILVLAWLVFAASPYVALYNLARAVEARDVATIQDRVNFRAVRAALTKELVVAYLEATGRGAELSASRKQMAGAIGGTIADPLVAQYVTPEALIDLLRTPPASAGGAAPSLGRIEFGSLRDAWALFANAETRGFRVISFALPPEKPAKEQFRLVFRLNPMTWRLVGIDLPEPVKQRLVQELIKANPTAS
jgi:hypothetical protein